MIIIQTAGTGIADSFFLIREFQSQCYSRNPERQGGKPLISLLNSLYDTHWGSNPDDTRTDLWIQAYGINAHW